VSVEKRVAQAGRPSWSEPDEQFHALTGDFVNDLSAYSRFPKLEQQFRELFLSQNQARATVSTAIYLALIAIVTAVNLFGNIAPLPEAELRTVFALRLGVACPALILILCAIEFKPLQRVYQPLVASAALVLGISVMSISAISAASGIPQFQMGDVLVVIYSCLFLGLLIQYVIGLACALVAAFLGIGILVGVAPADLSFAAAVIVTTALMAVLSAARLERLVRTNLIEKRTLNEIAERDGLTGLFNRRKFDFLVRQLWEQAKRDNQRLQLLFVDIDNFKSYNDVYGHQAGDECIRRVARVVDRAAKRPLDFCARYGGEEFVVVLYGPSATDLCVVAEQIRAHVVKEGIPHSGSSVEPVITVSVGSAAVVPNARRSLSGLIQQADESLYAAKQAGRNLVVHEDVDEFGSTGAFEIPSAG
jgi:diguanylate cyclase (GGDEF)-like protein